MVKKYKPITPGLRGLILPSNEDLTRANSDRKALVKPLKSLLRAKIRTNGRNSDGHITCRHKGGGHKRFYRLVDFKRDKEGIPAKVSSTSYKVPLITKGALIREAYVEAKRTIS